MHTTTLLTTALLALTPLVSAHARISYPAPLGGEVGDSYNAPLKPDGSDFPCKNMHIHPSYASTPPAATWQAGSSAHFEIQGHDAPAGQEGSLAAHSGGSCQASISFDNGKTFKVLHSFEGGCPRGVALYKNLAGPDQKFPFEIPAEARAGEALFAWTWVAVTGNRDEFYMNCAKVEIEGSGKSTLRDYPDMFVGDLTKAGVVAPGECRSTAGFALKYPDAGENVTQDKVDGIEFKEPSPGVCALNPGMGAGDEEEVQEEETMSTEVEPVAEEDVQDDDQDVEVPSAGNTEQISLSIGGKMCRVICD